MLSACKNTTVDKTPVAKKSVEQMVDESSENSSDGGDDKNEEEHTSEIISEPEEPQDYTEIYAAYLNVLQQENQQQIVTYRFPEKQVAFCDIYGDSAPELLYITTLPDDKWQASLNIYTFDDDGVRLLYCDIIDNGTGGSHNFCLFTLAGEKMPYIHNGSYNETTRLWYDCIIEKASQQLERETILEHKIYFNRPEKADEYWYEGNECTESEYNTQVSDLTESIEHIIWYSGAGYTDTGKYQEQLSHAAIDDEAMSYQGAIGFLNEQLGITIQPDQFISCAGDWVSNNRFQGIDLENGVCDIMQITDIANGQFLCNIGFYRLKGFDFVGTIDSDNHATLYSATSDIYGELTIEGEQIIIDFEDRSNIYFDSSLAEFIGLHFVFTRNP